jgi:purine-binding chemotaxis protein CheW
MKHGDSDDDQAIDPQQDLQDYVDLMLAGDFSLGINPGNEKEQNRQTTEKPLAIENKPPVLSGFSLATSPASDNQAASLPITATPQSIYEDRLSDTDNNPPPAGGAGKDRAQDEYGIDRRSTRTAAYSAKPVSASVVLDNPNTRHIRKMEELQQKLIHQRVKNLTTGVVHFVSDAGEGSGFSPAPRPPDTDLTADVALPQTDIVKPAQSAPAQNTSSENIAIDKLSVESEVSLKSPEIIQEKNPDPDPLKDSTAVSVEAKARQLQWCDNGRPQWAQEAFECLLFKVSGLTLAVPLVELGAIHPLNSEITPLFGQIDWFIGLLRTPRANIRVVNTAKVVMPEKYSDDILDTMRYAISINGHDWGLAVDSVDKAITLKPDAVRWRTVRSKRPWLAGTVVEYMCALIDVQSLTEMLNAQDHNLGR